MRLLSAVGILLACIVVPIRQSMASTRTRHAIIRGEPMQRGQQDDPDAPPLTDSELLEAKELMHRYFLEGDVAIAELSRVVNSIRRTVDEEELDILQYEVVFLQNALDRQPEVAPEDDDPNFPPAEERYAAREKNKAYTTGELGIVPLEERQEFQRIMKYTPAEKELAIKIKNAKLSRFRRISAALKKHESGEEILSDDVLEDYTTKMERLKAEKKASKPRNPNDHRDSMPPGMEDQMHPNARQILPGMGQMPQHPQNRHNGGEL